MHFIIVYKNYIYAWYYGSSFMNQVYLEIPHTVGSVIGFAGHPFAEISFLTSGLSFDIHPQLGGGDLQTGHSSLFSSMGYSVLFTTTGDPESNHLANIYTGITRIITQFIIS